MGAHAADEAPAPPGSVEELVLAAFDKAAVAAEQPAVQAAADARKARHTSSLTLVVLFFDVVFTVLVTLAVIHSNQAIDASKKATATFQDDSCIRGNAYRADDKQRWDGLFNLVAAQAPKPSATAHPRSQAQLDQEAKNLAAFKAFIDKVDTPTDCSKVVTIKK